jgi:hypothetical protein
VLRLQIVRSNRILTAAALLAFAGCSSASGTGGVPPISSQASMISQVSLDNGTKAELFVGDSGTNEVSTFAWPKPKSPTGSLTGFSEPQGGCSDAKGDVYVANTGDSNLLGFAVGNSKPINTLNDTGQYPVGCSYDWKYGNIAAANIISISDGPGSVSIYAKEKGSPKTIGSSLVTRFYSIAYDGSGNLYASGENSLYQLALAELPAGSNTFKAVCPKLLAKGLSVAGWDGKYVLFDGDGAVYRVKGCTIVGSTHIGGATGSVAVSEGRIVVANAGSASVDIYSYPKGKLLQTLTGFSEPIGVAIGGVKTK